MEAYDRVAKVVAPKKIALAEAEATLEKVRAGRSSTRCIAMQCFPRNPGSPRQPYHSRTPRNLETAPNNR